MTVIYGGKTTTFTVDGVVESGGNEISLVWTDGKNIFNGIIDTDGQSITQTIDVSNISTITITTTKTSWFSAPKCYNADNYVRINNNENANYMGGTYPMEITFDVTSIMSIIINCETNFKQAITVRGE